MLGHELVALVKSFLAKRNTGATFEECVAWEESFLRYDPVIRETVRRSHTAPEIVDDCTQDVLAVRRRSVGCPDGSMIQRGHPSAPGLQGLRASWPSSVLAAARGRELSVWVNRKLAHWSIPSLDPTSSLRGCRNTSCLGRWYWSSSRACPSASAALWFCSSWNPGVHRKSRACSSSQMTACGQLSVGSFQSSAASCINGVSVRHENRCA